MKKIIAFVLALTMLGCLFAGCGSSKTPADDGAANVEATNAPAEFNSAEETDYASMTIEELKPLLQTVTAGKLTVATSPDFAPYEFYALDDAGNPTLAGFDVALAQYVADYLGLELEIIPMDFDGTITELGNKKCDLSLAGYSPDPDREIVMDFSDTYYTCGQSFVTAKGGEDLFPTLADANKAEYQIGAQVASIQYDLAMENTPDADIVTLTKVTDIIAELLSGKLNGAFIETAVAETYAIVYPDLVVLHEVPYDQEGSVIGVSKDNGPLLAAVNMAIAAALEDGSMDQFVADANDLATGNIYEGLLEDAE